MSYLTTMYAYTHAQVTCLINTIEQLNPYVTDWWNWNGVIYEHVAIYADIELITILGLDYTSV